MSNRYVNRWGKLRQVKIPNSIIQYGTIVVEADSLAVLLVLLQIAKNKQVKDHDSFVKIKVGHKKLIERTGYSKNAVTRATKGLRDKGIVEPILNRKKHGEFGASEYILCDPAVGQPLPAKGDVIYENQLAYFTFPECVVTEHTANWSVAAMSSSEIKLYTSILYLANRHKNNEFTATAAELCTVSGLTPATFRKALDKLECRGLVWVRRNPKGYGLNLCDPYTGEPLKEFDGNDQNEPANYFIRGDKGQAKRVNLNAGKPEQIEKLVRSCCDEVVRQGNGDFTIRCPFHPDSNPSCSVSPTKNGCFHCFGCGKNGSLTELIMELRGMTKGEAIQQMATVMGMDIEFHQPDANAVAIYSYRNEKGKLLKQVVRYPDEDGSKVFRQRRPAKGGWIWNVSGLPPMLFNRESLEFADVVCITEGEKDAESVTALGLNGGCMIGTTSGGAESWDASLAKQLVGYRVVVMPDADEPGKKFAENVKASLEAEGIEYRTVTFDDVGQKDVSDFLQAGHTAEELAQRIAGDWVQIPGVQYSQGDGGLPETAYAEMDIAI